MVLVALAGILFFTISLYGWGSLFERCLRTERFHWTVTVLVGLATIMFLGGVVNALHIAYPITLATIAIGGLVLAGLSVKQQFGSTSALRITVKQAILAQRDYYILVAAIIGAIMLFTIVTQFTPRAFNWHDDFQKYFAHPVRMVQTGTFFGSPMSTLGSATLGGQAYLQGYVVAFFPIQYINAVDAVFGLFVCLLLLSQFTLRHGKLLDVTAFGLLALLIIHPQYVNVSSLYIGSALILGAIAVTTRPTEPGESPTAPSPAAIGLIYAAMMTCKSSFLLIVALHIPAIAVALGLANRSLLSPIKWLIRCSLWLLLFLSPWLLTYAKDYHSGLTDPVAAKVQAGPDYPETLNLFSFEPITYGATIGNYSLVFAGVVIAGAIVLVAGWQADKSVSQRALMTAAVAGVGAAGYLIMLHVFAWKLAGFQQSVRYYTYASVAIPPAVFVLTATLLDEVKALGTPIARRILLGVVAALPVAAFLPSFLSRVSQLQTVGNQLAFTRLSTNVQFLDYMQRNLSDEERARVQKQQSLVPPGEPIVAWINEPFYLDYKRNTIYDVDTAGMLTTWARVPPARYVMWEYKGIGLLNRGQYQEGARSAGAQVRMIAKLAMVFGDEMSPLLSRGKILYDDGRTYVFELPEPIPRDLKPPAATGPTTR